MRSCFLIVESACKIVYVGSMQSDLHPIAVEIFQFSASNGVELELQWMSPTENEKADYISRVLANFSRLFHVFRAKLGRSFSGLFC